MHSSGSVIKTILERIRGPLDESSAKWNNDYILRHVVGPCSADIMGRLAHDYNNPIFLTHSLSLDPETLHYPLPPCIGEIWQIAEVDTSGRTVREYLPRGILSFRGPGWMIEGNSLRFMPDPPTSAAFDVWYVSNGDFMPHYSENAGTDTGGTLAADLKTFTLSASPTLGGLDRRSGSLAGSMLRLLPSSGAIQEQIIETHDAATNTCVTRSTFATGSDAANLTYEVVQQESGSWAEAVATAAALKHSTALNVTQKKSQMLLRDHQVAMKTLGDRLSGMNRRRPLHFDSDTRDNEDMVSQANINGYGY